jgi:uncharacterized protein with GYD domain
MPTYITLLRWTPKGIENIKESPARLDAAKKTMKDMGAQFKAFYLVTGKYDLITIVEAPDEETMTKINLALASRGAVRTETHRAFTEEEYRKIIAALPK